FPCPFRKFHPARDLHRYAEASHDRGRCSQSKDTPLGGLVQRGGHSNLVPGCTKIAFGYDFGSDSLRHAGRPAVLDFYASRAVVGDVRAGPYQGERGVPGRFPSGHPTRASLIATLSGSGGQPNVVATVTGNNLLVVPASLLTNDPRAIEL